MHFDFVLPVDFILNAVDELMELFEHPGIQMNAEKLVNLSYVIFARQPILLQELCDRHKKTAGKRLGPI